MFYVAESRSPIRVVILADVVVLLVLGMAPLVKEILVFVKMKEELELYGTPCLNDLAASITQII